MTDTQRISGVLSPVVTPFDADLRPDGEKLTRHCRWLLDNDVGLAVFGTNSEANSLSLQEKMSLLSTLVESGIPGARMMPGTGCCSISDSVELTRHAVNLGCAGTLMLPPFFYKGVSDEGLFRNYSEIIQRVGDSRLRIYLYHIPPVAQVPISIELIERLLKEYPGTIAGVKDSSGEWSNTARMLEQFQPQGFDVFAGSETYLLQVLRGGGAGCISATANVNPGPIAALGRTWQQADADDQQSALDAVRAIFADYVMIPALKAAIAHYSATQEWITLRPPLVELNESQRAQLTAKLDAAGFTMPGLAEATAGSTDND
jgi:4-hydroxy-tetrahydrodipicolinate synthase